MASVPKSRIQELIKLQCQLFNRTYNPTCTRTGNWVLRQKLRGPAAVQYYPPRVSTLRELRRMFPQWETYDDDEVDRADALAILKARGKGAPKKKRTAEESKKFAKRKPVAKPPPA